MRTRAMWAATVTALAISALATIAPGQGTSSTSSSQPGGTGRQCVIAGETPVPRNLPVFDQPTGGNQIAKLTGASLRLVAHDFPKTKGGRVAVQTGDGTGKGNFRLEGWIEADKLPLYTKAEVPVVQGHVWMGANREVSFMGSSKDRLQVKLQAQHPIRQAFTAWASCNRFSLSPGTPPGWSTPGKARGYVVKKDSIDLYDTYSRERSVVTTLYNASEEGILMWSTENAHGGYVHVVHHGEVVVDAWAQFRDLKRLPWGETMDQQSRATRTVRSGPKLAVQGDTKSVTASKEVVIRLEPKDDAPMIGVIEVGAELLVLDVVVGFASIMPKSLAVAPEGGHFWANAKDLGVAP